MSGGWGHTIGSRFASRVIRWYDLIHSTWYSMPDHVTIIIMCMYFRPKQYPRQYEESDVKITQLNGKKTEVIMLTDTTQWLHQRWDSNSQPFDPLSNALPTEPSTNSSMLNHPILCVIGQTTLPVEVNHGSQWPIYNNYYFVPVFVLFVLMLYIPANNFSVLIGHFPVFLGWTKY